MRKEKPLSRATQLVKQLVDAAIDAEISVEKQNALALLQRLANVQAIAASLQTITVAKIHSGGLDT